MSENKKTNTANTANVLEFSQTYEQLLDLANKADDKNDKGKAIRLLQKAIALHPQKLDAKCRLAEVYADVGLYALSNNLLYWVLLRAPYETDGYYLLGQNAFALGKWNAAGYYFNLFATESDDADIDWDAIDGLMENVQSKTLHVVNERDVAAHLEEQARESLGRGDFAKAAEIFEQAAEHSQDIATKNNLALAYCIAGKLPQAKQYAEEVLALNPQDVFGRCNMLLIASLTGDEPQAQECRKFLEETVPADLQQLLKMVSVLANLQEDELLYRKTKEYLQKEPYQVDVALLAFFAAFNTGRKEEAKELLLFNLTLDPEDPVSSFYLENFDALDGRLGYLPQVTEQEMKRRILLLQNEKTYTQLWKDSKRKAVLDWAYFTLDNVAFLDAVTSRVAHTAKKNWVPYFKKELLDCRIQDRSKEEMLCALLRSGAGRYAYVQDGILREVIVPDLRQNPWMYPLARAIGKMAWAYLLEEDYVQKLIDKAAELDRRIETLQLPTQEYHSDDMAAFLVQQCGFDLDTKELLTYFDTSAERLSDLNRLLFE